MILPMAHPGDDDSALPWRKNFPLPSGYHVPVGDNAICIISRGYPATAAISKTF